MMAKNDDVETGALHYSIPGQVQWETVLFTNSLKICILPKPFMGDSPSTGGGAGIWSEK